MAGTGDTLAQPAEVAAAIHVDRRGLGDVQRARKEFEVVLVVRARVEMRDDPVVANADGSRGVQPVAGHKVAATLQQHLFESVDPDIGVAGLRHLGECRPARDVHRHRRVGVGQDGVFRVLGRVRVDA